VSNAIEVTGLLKQVLADINSGEGMIGRLIGDRDFGRQFADDLSLTIANMESATNRLDALFSKIDRGEGAIGALMSKDREVNEIIDNLQRASKGMAAVSAQLSEGRGTIGRLIYDEEFAAKTLGDLGEASTSIADIAKHISSGNGTIGKLVYDDQLYDDASAFVGGGSGGFWKLIGRSLLFFWPFDMGNDAARAETE
jgi:phospholipid/cholesterol/gamma-HCH transport system substrate-binding protein